MAQTSPVPPGIYTWAVADWSYCDILRIIALYVKVIRKMKYLAIDFGMKRVGLAISEGELATPWKVLEGIGLENFVLRISKLINEVGFDKIIVGMPEGEMGKLTKQFVAKMRQRGFDIEEVDETLSTQRAVKIMVELGLPKKKRAQPDAQAAAEILQTYLEDHR